MSRTEEIHDGVYLVGGPNLSSFEDATVFVVECDEGLVMIDSGAGKNTERLQKNIVAAGLDPADIAYLILTHCHVDHIGSARAFRDSYGCRIVAHTLDAVAIESGDPVLTAAGWYNTCLPQTPVDVRLAGEHEVISLGGSDFHCLHTPGHTPGSLAVYLDRAGTRVLFGQDIHGPFYESFGSDIAQWRTSMERLLDLEADILCEGHFGIFRPRSQVERYIRDYLDRYAEEYP